MATASTLYTESTQAMKAHDWQAAFDLLRERELERKQDWRLYWNRGWSAYQLGRGDEALQDFLKALRYVEAPGDRATCLTFAGIAALGSEKVPAAINYLSQALTLEDHGLTRKTLAWAHMEAGDAEAAERVHKTGLQKAPDDRERLAAYGDFLVDQGRVEEAYAIRNKLEE